MVAVLGIAWPTGAQAAGKPRVRITVKPAVVAPSAPVRVSGRLTGRLPVRARALRVRLQQRAGSKWRTRVTSRPTKARRFKVRWAAPAQAGNVRLRLRLYRKRRVVATSASWRLTVAAPAPAPAPGPSGGGIPTPPTPGGGITPAPAPTETIVVAPATVKTAPAPGAAGVLTLSGSVPVETGDVLASGVGAAAPYGFLLKASAVRAEGGDTAVDVVPATLLEAMPEGEIDQTFAAADRVAGGRRVRPEHFRTDATCEAGGTVTVEGSLDLGGPQWNLHAHWDKFPIPHVDRAEATVSIGASAHASASASGTASCTVGPVTLVERKLPPITFDIGIPVVIVPELEVELGGLGRIDAEISTSVDASVTGTAGAKYEDGSLSPVAEIDHDFGFEPPDPQAKATLSGTLDAELEGAFYGAGGPAVTLSSGLEANADPDARDPWWTLDAPVSLTAGLEIDVLGIDEGPLTIYEHRFRLAEAPPREPVYRIVGGAMHYKGDSVYTCTLGHGDCFSGDSYDAGSIRRDRGTDVQFTVHEPGATDDPAELTAPLDIVSWAHRYVERINYSRTPCGTPTTQVVTDSDLQHDGGTTPSVYNLALSVTPGETLDDFTAALLPSADTEPRFGWVFPIGLRWSDSGRYSTFLSTYSGSGNPDCRSSGSNRASMVGRQPFDFYSVIAEVDRPIVVTPPTYGSPTCTGAVCVRRVTGRTEWTYPSGDGVTRSGGFTIDWWADVEVRPRSAAG